MSRFAMRFHFSLRTLLVGMLLISALAGGLGIMARQVVLQRNAVEEIRNFGGSVDYGNPFYVRWFGYRGRGAGWARSTFPNWVSSVVAVHIDASEFSDNEFPVLTQLPNLKVLHLSRTSITDKSLSSLGRFNDLETVWLPTSSVTAAGVEQLQREIPRASIHGGSWPGHQATPKVAR